MDSGQYTITLDHERGLVHVIAIGEFDRDLGDELITSARTEAAAHRYNILCDVREAQVSVEMADWFFLPRRLAVYKNIKMRTIKTAIVINVGRQEKMYKFFETVTSNLGMSIRIFVREGEALDWLRDTR